MKAGDLVKVMKPDIGIPSGTYGLIVDTQYLYPHQTHTMGKLPRQDQTYIVYQVVELYGLPHERFANGIVKHKYIPKDLELISEAI